MKQLRRKGKLEKIYNSWHLEIHEAIGLYYRLRTNISCSYQTAGPGHKGEKIDLNAKCFRMIIVF